MGNAPNTIRTAGGSRDTLMSTQQAVDYEDNPPQKGNATPQQGIYAAPQYTSHTYGYNDAQE